MQIEYHRSSHPQVSVSDWWRELPEKPVVLPGGRNVEFVIFGTLGPSADPSALKKEAALKGY